MGIPVIHTSTMISDSELDDDDDDDEFIDALESEDELEEEDFPNEEEEQEDEEGDEFSEDSNTHFSAHIAMPVPFHTRFGLRVDFNQLKASDKKTPLEKTFAYQLFGDRLIMVKWDLTKSQGNMPMKFTEPNGYQYEILCSKFEKQMQSNIPKKTLTMYCVLVHGGPNNDDRSIIIKPIHLQKELDKVANWGALPLPKNSARLELLFSTAVWGLREADTAVYTNLSSRDIELIPENSHVGCGFITRTYLEQFLGTRIRGTRTFAI